MRSTSSSLALRALFKSAAHRAGVDKSAHELTGLSCAAVAFHAALRADEAPLLLIVPTDADVDQMVTDARFFQGALTGATDVDTRAAVRALPSQEVDPYRGLAPHLQIASVRAATLQAMATGTARLVVASARALAPRLSAPARLGATGLSIAPGTEISPTDLGELVALAGFIPEDPVDEPGEFCVRGGIVDLYPAGEAQPFRLEFIGDVVESVRLYDAATQRSQAGIDRIVVAPQRELLGDPAAPDDPAAFDRSATVLDYARKAGAAVLVCEIEDVLARGREQEDQWRKSAADMDARGRPGPPFDAIAWSWDQAAAWLSSARRVSELAVGEGSADARHVSCLPAAQYHGRIADWVDELRKACNRPKMNRRRGSPIFRSDPRPVPVPQNWLFI